MNVFLLHGELFVKYYIIRLKSPFSLGWNFSSLKNVGLTKILCFVVFFTYLCPILEFLSNHVGIMNKSNMKSRISNPSFLNSLLPSKVGNIPTASRGSF